MLQLDLRCDWVERIALRTGLVERVAANRLLEGTCVTELAVLGVVWLAELLY